MRCCVTKRWPSPPQGIIAVGKRHKKFYSLCPNNLSPRNLSQGNNPLVEWGKNLQCTKTFIAELFIILKPWDCQCPASKELN